MCIFIISHACFIIYCCLKVQGTKYNVQTLAKYKYDTIVLNSLFGSYEDISDFGIFAVYTLANQFRLAILPCFVCLL